MAGNPAVTALAAHVERYLALRRGLGFKLVEDEGMLADLVDHLDRTSAEHLTVEAALGWAVLAPTDDRRARRLTVARRFARYLVAFDPDSEIPPARVYPAAPRPTPYFYTSEQIASLMEHARRLQPRLWATSVTTMVGLMAVTGIRPGEARRAGRDHIDLETGRLSILDSKNGRSRLLPLHPSTVAALAAYVEVRDRNVDPTVHALFVDPTGGPIGQFKLSSTFRALRTAAGIKVPEGHRTPRAGDLRHSFAVSALMDWHAEKADVAARLPILSAYMGHQRPSDTYWYLEAAPELMAVVADRLADWEAKR